LTNSSANRTGLKAFHFR